MKRKKTGSARLRIIVPDYAKSAGTLMVLGPDSVVMSDTSELGPIDPQIIRSDRNRNMVWHSVTSYLDAYADHTEALKKDPTDVTAQMMLNKLDPETVTLFKNVMKRARNVAEGHLKLGMMNTTGNWSQAVTALLDGKQFRTDLCSLLPGPSDSGPLFVRLLIRATASSLFCASRNPMLLDLQFTRHTCGY